jgi:ADP-ribosylarginine hydrolase
MENIEASFMFASYFETLGYCNGKWEFNYTIETNTLAKYNNIWTILLHHYMVLGGPNKIDISGWNASDDTIMIIATAEAALKGGGEANYIKAYLDNYDLLYDSKRTSGITTIETLKLLKKGVTLKNMPIKSNMGGNGAAMRTGPIGLIWKNDEEKIIEESIIASRVTHNYYIGFLGGMVTALFTSYAINKVNPWEWVERLLLLYRNKTIHKYYPKDHNIEDLDEYMSYWKRYNETRINKLKYKNSLDSFIFPSDRAEYLLGFYPNNKIKSMVIQGKSLKGLEWDWNRIGSSGLDSCIYAYDCLLMSIQTPGSKLIDFANITYSIETFITLVAIHPGDNDTTGAIGGMWYGALNGYKDFDKERLKELEFNKELKKVTSKID